MKGYHQIRMDPDSKCKTAITCYMDLYQYQRMPFEPVVNELAIQCGKVWNFAFVCLDNLLIVSSSTYTMWRKY